MTIKADRQPNGYRAYSALDMRELNFIKRARSLGFSVEEVRDLLDLWRDKRRTSVAVKAVATRHLKALDRKIKELKSVRAQPRAPRQALPSAPRRRGVENFMTPSCK